MALFDDLFESGLGIGLGAGVVGAIGVAVLGPVVTPVLRSGAKLAIRGGLMAFDWSRERAGELAEMAGDIAAETRAEAAGHTHGGASRNTKSS